MTLQETVSTPEHFLGAGSFEGTGLVASDGDDLVGSLTPTVSTIVQPSTAGKWSRLLTGTGTVSVRQITLDGNIDAREWDGAYNLEQSALLYFHDGHFDIRDVTLKDTPADGLHLGVNAHATVENVVADNCFRGALTASGGNSSLTARNVRPPEGEAASSHLHVEVDGLGSNGELDVTVDVADSHFSSALLQAWGDITLSGVDIDSGFFLRADGGGTVRVTDCTIGLHPGAFADKLYWPRDVTFVRCGFVGSPLYIYPEVLGQTFVGQRVEFQDCTFVGDGDQAVYNMGDRVDRGNQVVFTGTNTFAGFDAGYVTRAGWFASVSGALAPVS